MNRILSSLLLWVALVANGVLGFGCCFREFALAGKTPGAAYGDNHMFALALLAVCVLFYVNFVQLLLATLVLSSVSVVFPAARLPRSRTVAVLTNVGLVVLAFAPWEAWDRDLTLPFPVGGIFVSIAVLSFAAFWLWNRNTRKASCGIPG